MIVDKGTVIENIARVLSRIYTDRYGVNVTVTVK